MSSALLHILQEMRKSVSLGKNNCWWQVTHNTECAAKNIPIWPSMETIIEIWKHEDDRSLPSATAFQTNEPIAHKVCNSMTTRWGWPLQHPPTHQHYITIHLQGCNIHVDRGSTEVRVETLTAITSSKGCLYTRTGDWYFCTMVGITVTPTTWTTTGKNLLENINYVR